MTLPAFLLAYAESNIVWLGLKKHALPAVNTRWSLARVLALTAVNTALGVGLGCVISLLAAGQLLGWLLWLLGVFMACQGSVCYALTALCWNQRVARLKQNPDLSLRLPPARFVVFRWGLGLFYFLVVAVITPLAMLITIVNVYWQLAWKRERDRLVAQGQRLTLREIIGPEVPAAENAWAAPVFAPLFDYQPNSEASIFYPRILHPEASNTVARMRERLWLPDKYLPRDTSKSPKENLAEWSAAYRRLVAAPGKNDPSWAAELKLPPPGNPARDVLAGLSVADEVVAEICAAAARPRAQAPVGWDRGCPLPLEHFAFLKNVQQNLNLRCAAHLGAGETDAAFAVATNALNVAELLREEPLLISQLVRIALGTTVIRNLRQGLVEHRWTDAQLAAFQEQLGRMDYLAGLVRAIEGERAFEIAYMDAVITGPAGTKKSSESFRRVITRIPLGVLRANQTALARMHTVMLTDLRQYLAQAHRVGLADLCKTWEKKHSAEPFSPFSFLARVRAPASAKLETHIARAHTTVQLAITACALERYRLAHGSFPETLDALVPAFLAKPLLDPMTAQPFRYRLTDDGWFLLYSVGEDGRDDGGVFRTGAKEPIKDWPWPVPMRPEAGSLF